MTSVIDGGRDGICICTIDGRAILEQPTEQPLRIHDVIAVTLYQHGQNK